MLDLRELPLVLRARDAHRLLQRHHLSLRRLRPRLGHGLRVGGLLDRGGGGLRHAIGLQEAAELLDLRLQDLLVPRLRAVQSAQRAQLLPLVVHRPLELDLLLQLELMRLLERAEVVLHHLAALVRRHATRIRCQKHGARPR